MPKLWSEGLYDPNTSTIKHPDIVALDVEHGKWFQCKWCKNPKDLAENKFVCRTPFSTEFLVARGHFESKLHKDNKAAAEKKPGLKALFATASSSVETSSAPEVVDVPAISPKPPMPCKGLGWDVTHKDQPWDQYCKTYMFFVEGAKNKIK